MGYQELDRSSGIARMKLEQEINNLVQNVRDQVSGLHQFATEHPESGYRVETTAAEKQGSPLVQVFDPEGNEVARSRAESFTTLYGPPTESGTMDQLTITAYDLTLSHGKPGAGNLSFMVQKMDRTHLSHDPTTLDSQYASVQAAKRKLRGMARAPKPPSARRT